MKTVFTLAVMLFASITFSQPGGGGGGGGAGGGDRPERPEGPPGDRTEFPALSGPGGRAGPGRGDPFERMRAYLEIVDRFSRMSRDATTTGIAAVISAGDVLKPRGAEAAIEYFTKQLPNVKNEAVARAIRLQLIDLYRAANQGDKALEQISELLSTTPAESTSSSTGAK